MNTSPGTSSSLPRLAMSLMASQSVLLLRLKGGFPSSKRVLGMAVSSLKTYSFAAEERESSAWHSFPKVDLTAASRTCCLKATTSCQCKYPVVPPDSS